MAEFRYISSPDQLIEHEYYALPHEMQLLDAQVRHIRQKRGVIANDINSTMGESSESWHDNAPAEALFGEMYQLDISESGLTKATRHLTEVPYPTPDLDFITIGSRIRYEFFGETFVMDVAGNLPITKLDSLDEEIERGSIAAPLPRSLLGAKVADLIRPTINERVVEVVVIDIDQLAQAAYFREPAPET